MKHIHEAYFLPTRLQIWQYVMPMEVQELQCFVSNGKSPPYTKHFWTSSLWPIAWGVCWWQENQRRTAPIGSQQLKRSTFFEKRKRHHCTKGEKASLPSLAEPKICCICNAFSAPFYYTPVCKQPDEEKREDSYIFSLLVCRTDRKKMYRKL